MHTIRALSWKRLCSIGWDGLVTLIWSMAVILVSGGLTLLACWFAVFRSSRSKRADTAGHDIVFVLGSRLDRGDMTPEFEARLDTALRLAGTCPIAILGGMAPKGGRTEAAIGGTWLVDRGFDQGRIILEEDSRNTLENLIQARNLMRMHGLGKPILVTSAYHRARTSILANGLGIPHAISAADFPSMLHPIALSRGIFEGLLINWYYSGRTLARLMGLSGLLARIS